MLNARPRSGSLAVLAGIALGGGLFAARTDAASAAAGARHEVTSARTETTRTFELSDGTFEFESSSEPLNYRDDSGRWQPYDTKLEQDKAGNFQVKSSSLDITFPHDASDAASVGDGRYTVAVRPLGAQGAGQLAADGRSTAYSGPLSNGELRYSTQAKGLVQQLSLGSDRAIGKLRFSVLADGLSTASDGRGGVAFAAGGQVRFRLSAPLLSGSDGTTVNGRYRIRRTPAGTVLQVVGDRGSATARLLSPVTISSELAEVSGYTMCEIANGVFYRDRTYCGRPTSLIGPSRDQFGQIASVSRVTMRPDLSRIPRGALAIGATFSFNAITTLTSTLHVGLFSLTRDLGARPTWNTADGTTPWTTPGGDYEAAPEAAYVLDATRGPTTFNYHIGPVARRWLNGTRANQGLLLRAIDENNVGMPVTAGTVRIRYRLRTGVDEPALAYEHHRLGDGSRVSVNLTNGNLVVANDDFKLDTVDDSLTVQRMHNSRDDVDPATPTFGRRWRGDFGTVVLEWDPLERAWDLNGPSGIDRVFTRPAGSFGAFVDDDATLTEEWADNTMTIRFTRSDERWVFQPVTTERYRLVRRQYPSEEGTSAVYDSAGRLSSLTDAAGDSATFGWDTSGQMRTLTDQDGGQRHYDYDAQGRLARFTDTSAAQTSYGYDAAGRVNAIALLDGSGLAIRYGTDGVVQTLTPLAAGGVAGSTTTYTFAPATTTVATPGEKTRVLSFESTLFNSSTAVGAAPPTLTLSGDLRGTANPSLPDRTLPVGPSSLRWEAGAADGIEEVRVLLDGDEDEATAPSCSGGCPLTLTGTYTLDTNEVGSGPHVVSVVATTSSGDTRTRAFRILVPESTWTSSGEIPEDLTETDPDPSYVMSGATCAAAYGTEAALYCDGEDGDLGLAGSSLGPTTLAARPPVRFGIAQDFGTNDWLDTRYAIGLRSKYYRRLLPFNLMETVDGRHFNGDPSQLKHQPEFNSFVGLYDAITKGSRDRPPGELMVSFELAACPGCTGPDRPAVRIPSVARYEQYLGDFLERFSNVHVISSWNEPNAKRQPLHKPLLDSRGRGVTPEDEILRTRQGGAPRAAHYTAAATRVCDRWIRARAAAGKRTQCTVLAAEIAQSRPPISTSAPSHQYLLAYRRALLTLFDRRENRGLPFPGIWAFHPYTDVQNDTRDRDKPTGTDYFGRSLVPGRQIWFTEVGSRVDRGDTRNGNYRNTLQRQAAEVRFLFGTLVRRRPNITRMYYYALCAPPIDPTNGAVPPETEKFDSGLVGGRPDDPNVHGTCRDFDRTGYVAKRDAYDIAARYIG